MPGLSTSGLGTRDGAAGPEGAPPWPTTSPLPPPPAGPPDFAALAQAAAWHQITILAPPPEP